MSIHKHLRIWSVFTLFIVLQLSISSCVTLTNLAVADNVKKTSLANKPTEQILPVSSSFIQSITDNLEPNKLLEIQPIKGKAYFKFTASNTQFYTIMSNASSQIDIYPENEFISLPDANNFQAKQIGLDLVGLLLNTAVRQILVEKGKQYIGVINDVINKVTISMNESPFYNPFLPGSAVPVKVGWFPNDGEFHRSDFTSGSTSRSWHSKDSGTQDLIDSLYGLYQKSLNNNSSVSSKAEFLEKILSKEVLSEWPGGVLTAPLMYYGPDGVAVYRPASNKTKKNTFFVAGSIHTIWWFWQGAPDYPESNYIIFDAPSEHLKSTCERCTTISGYQIFSSQIYTSNGGASSSDLISLSGLAASLGIKTSDIETPLSQEILDRVICDNKVVNTINPSAQSRLLLRYQDSRCNKGNNASEPISADNSKNNTSNENAFTSIRLAWSNYQQNGKPLLGNALSSESPTSYGFIQRFEQGEIHYVSKMDKYGAPIGTIVTPTHSPPLIPVALVTKTNIDIGHFWSTFIQNPERYGLPISGLNDEISDSTLSIGKSQYFEKGTIFEHVKGDYAGKIFFVPSKFVSALASLSSNFEQSLGFPVGEAYQSQTFLKKPAETMKFEEGFLALPTGKPKDFYRNTDNQGEFFEFYPENEDYSSATPEIAAIYASRNELGSYYNWGEYSFYAPDLQTSFSSSDSKALWITPFGVKPNDVNSWEEIQRQKIEPYRTVFITAIELSPAGDVIKLLDPNSSVQDRLFATASIGLNFTGWGLIASLSAEGGLAVLESAFSTQSFNTQATNFKGLFRGAVPDPDSFLRIVKSGQKREEDIIKILGTNVSKNNKVDKLPLGPGKRNGTIFDVKLSSTNLEIKHVKYIRNTRQLRGQALISAREGKSYHIIASSGHTTLPYIEIGGQKVCCTQSVQNLLDKFPAGSSIVWADEAGIIQEELLEIDGIWKIVKASPSKTIAILK